MRHLQACAGGLGQTVPDPAFLFVVFLSSNDWRKWVNSAFRKTPLFKNCRCERLSLVYISKIEIYNPLSALFLTLVCHFYYVLLRVAIFVLSVAIATYFERRQKELSTKTLLWKIYWGKIVQFFTAQPLVRLLQENCGKSRRRIIERCIFAKQIRRGQWCYNGEKSLQLFVVAPINFFSLHDNMNISSIYQQATHCMFAFETQT